MLSAGHHRDWSIGWLTSVQDLESSRVSVRLDPLAGTGVRACQMGRRTCNEQTCTKLLVFALDIVHIFCLF